jgi:AraC-like DNA-binding protein/mannose-6-phosphate isomerase-like protein (cupin superfamily)
MDTIEESLHRRAAAPRSRLLATCFVEPVAWHTTPHQHDCAQLLAITAGAASFRAGSLSSVLPAGCFVYIPAHTVHSLDTTGPVSGMVLYLTVDDDAPLPDRLRVFHGSPLLREVMRRLANQQDGADRIEVERNLVRVLADEVALSELAATNMQMPDDERLKRMATELLNNPTDRRTFIEWADQLGFSARTLLRRFKEETGMTVIEWRQHAKILLAAQKLEAGASVKQAAAAAGYDSMSSFIKLFSRIKGTTPGSWTNSMKPG